MSTDFRKKVAEEMIRQIEAGTMPWQKPWQPGVIRTRPFNPISGKDYKGINAFWLEMQGRGDPRWLTYRQAQEAGAQVRKGEKSTVVEYWQWTRSQPVVDAQGNPLLDDDGRPRVEHVRLDRPRVFRARVFNAEQIDGLAPLVVPKPAFDPVPEAERILAAGGVPIRHDQGDRAFYRPHTDTIHLPPQAAFPAAYEYYATALHELGHATGHESRLARDFGPFGSRDYAVEELRAEMASFMLTTELGLGHYPERHAGYVESWLKVLNDDHNQLFRAARDAETIRTWVMEPEQRPRLERGPAMDNAQTTAPAVAPAVTPARTEAPSIRLPSLDGDATVTLERGMLRLSRHGDTVVFGSTPVAVRWAVENDVPAADLTAMLQMVGDAKALPAPDMIPAADGAIVSAAAPGETHHGPIIDIGDRHVLQRTADGLVMHDLAKVGYSGFHVASMVRAQDAGREVSITYGPHGRMTTLDAGHHPDLSDWRQRTERRSDVLLSAIGQWLREEISLETRRQGDVTGLMISGEELARVEGPLTQETGTRALIGALREALKAEGRTLQSDPARMSLDEFTLACKVGKMIPEFEISAQEIGTTVKAGPDGLLQVDVRELHERVRAELADRRQRPGATPEPERIYLDVPFAEKEQAKAAGARWDKEAKAWYAPADIGGVQLEALLEKWAAKNEKPQAPEAPEQAAGTEPPGKEKRTYLAVPYAEKNQAKAAGARWDRHAKAWYAPEGADMEALSRWQAKTPAQPAPDASPVEEFGEALRARGLIVQGAPVMDGRWHRVPVEGDRKGAMSGSYRGFLDDGVPNGQITNYKLGIQAEKWIATGVKIDPADRAHLQAQAAAKQAQRDAEKAAAQERAAQVARGLLNGAERIDSEALHPYLERKNAHPCSNVYVKDGNLLIPMVNAGGAVVNLQTISPEGEKRYLKDGQKQGAFHLIDPDREAGRRPMVVAEGYATAATLHQATGLPVAVAFDAGNLQAVGEILRAKYPNTPLVFAADNDHKHELEGKPNVGIEKATAAAEALGAAVVVPRLTDAEKAKGLTDFNDLVLARGPKALRDVERQIADALEPPKKQREQRRSSAMAM